MSKRRSVEELGERLLSAWIAASGCQIAQGWKASAEAYKKPPHLFSIGMRSGAA